MRPLCPALGFFFAGCAALGGERAQKRGEAKVGDCRPAALNDRVSLLGSGQKLKEALAERAAKGPILVEARPEGCGMTLRPLAACALSTGYRYQQKSTSESWTIKEQHELLRLSPLAAGRLSPELKQAGALRFDIVSPGELRLDDLSTVSLTGLEDDACRGATHLVTVIRVGSSALYAGRDAALQNISASSRLALPAGVRSLEQTGDATTCAPGQPRLVPGCDQPLALELLSLAGRGKSAPPTAEAPMIAIEKQSFMRGADDATPDQRPMRKIELSAFSIDRFEVSASAYSACVEKGACQAPGKGLLCTGGVLGREDHPINCVSWAQADSYCRSAQKRLPTEAEWEMAQRGNDARIFAFGDTWPPPANVGNFADRRVQEVFPHWNVIPSYEDGHVFTAPVTEFAEAASSLGVAQLSGNVAEWTADWYAPDEYPRSPAKDPSGPAKGKAKVVRGASFGDAQKSRLRVTSRAFYLPETRSMHIGFRCARSGPPGSDTEAPLPEGDG